jgi:hypothetical protein
VDLKAPLPVWKWYAKHRGYKEGYAYVKWRECQEHQVVLNIAQ